MFYFLFLLCISSYYFSLHAVHDDKLFDDFETECGKYLINSNMTQNIKDNILNKGIKFIVFAENVYHHNYKETGYQELNNYLKAKKVDTIILHQNLIILYNIYVEYTNKIDNPMAIKSYLSSFFALLFQQATETLEKNNSKSDNGQLQEIIIYLDKLESISTSDSNTDYLRYLLYYGNLIAEHQKKIFRISFQCKTMGTHISEEFLKDINMKNLILFHQGKEIDLTSEKEFYACMMPSSKNEREQEIKAYHIKNLLKYCLNNKLIIFQLNQYFAKEDQKIVENFKAFFKKYTIPLCPLFFNQTLYNSFCKKFPNLSTPEKHSLWHNISRPLTYLPQPEKQGGSIDINIFSMVDTINNQDIEKLVDIISSLYEGIGRSIKAFFNNKFTIQFICKNENQDKFNKNITKKFLASINDKINQNTLDNNNNNPIDKINTIRYYIIRLSCSGLIIAIIYLLSKNSDTIHKFFLKKPVVETE